MSIYKELLGDEFRDDLSNEQVEELISKKFQSLKESESKLKNSLSKSNSEASEWKKKYNETLTDEELKRTAKDEELNKIIKERDELKKEKNINEYYAKHLSLGYDEVLAKDSANALFNNDYAKLFENQKKFVENQVAKIKAEYMKGNPVPPNGGVQTITKEMFNKMTYSEMVNLKNTNPTLYNELIKK